MKAELDAGRVVLQGGAPTSAGELYDEAALMRWRSRTRAGERAGPGAPPSHGINDSYLNVSPIGHNSTAPELKRNFVVCGRAIFNVLFSKTFTMAPPQVGFFLDIKRAIFLLRFFAWFFFFRPGCSRAPRASSWIASSAGVPLPGSTQSALLPERRQAHVCEPTRRRCAAAWRRR